MAMYMQCSAMHILMAMRSISSKLYYCASLLLLLLDATTSVVSIVVLVQAVQLRQIAVSS
jgi:hypothetical protein